MSACRCDQALGFERSAQALISFHGIEPWSAKAEVRENWQRQMALARRTPLRHIPVQTGLEHFGGLASGWFQGLTKDRFVRLAIQLLEAQRVHHTQTDRLDLGEIFDSMDYDSNGQLSVGEWASGLTIFFAGTPEECVHAVFGALDRDGSRTLTRSELQEYVKPYVKAMTPPYADALRPLLVNKATETLYEEMDKDHLNDISAEEMVWWHVHSGNNLIDRLAELIDGEAYSIWYNNQQRQAAHRGLAPGFAPGLFDPGGGTVPSWGATSPQLAAPAPHHPGHGAPMRNAALQLDGPEYGGPTPHGPEYSGPLSAPSYGTGAASYGSGAAGYGTGIAGGAPSFAPSYGGHPGGADALHFQSAPSYGGYAA